MKKDIGRNKSAEEKGSSKEMPNMEKERGESV